MACPQISSIACPSAYVPTVWGSVAEVLAAKVASPWYTAVSECGPPASDGTTRVAAPAVRSTIPNAFELSMNVTVPVAAEGDTVAVSIRPGEPAIGDPTRAVVVTTVAVTNTGELRRRM